MGDIRVVVFDLPDDGGEVDPPGPVADLAARLFYGAVLLSMLVAFGWVALETAAWFLQGGLVPAALKAVVVLTSLYALAAWSLLLSALFRKGRDPRSRMGPVVHAVMSAVAFLLSLLLLLVDFRL